MTVLIVIVLLMMSALFSGATLGLMSLGPHDLKRKMALGDKRAAKIYPVRVKGNLLLVSLLLGNVAVNSILAVYLGSIASGIMASLSATLLITIFGEISPMAVFSRYAISFGAKTVGIIKVIMFVLYPITAPIAWLLDKILGQELPTVYSKQELVEILGEHSASRHSDVRADEERIARGALTFGDRQIKEVMTPRSVVVTVTEDQVIDKSLIKELTERGYSRFPVFDGDKEKVTGMLFAYDLIDPSVSGKKVKDVASRKVFFVNEEENLDHTLNGFIKTKNHLFIVVNGFSEMVGIITIEDVLEEIVGKEIVDEFDEYEDVRAVAEKKPANKVKTL